MKYYLFTTIFFLHINLNLQAQQSKILVTDLTKIKNIGNIQVSNAGNTVLYLLKSTIQNPTNNLEYDYNTQLWLSDGVSSRQITFGSESVGAFSISPDGKTVAFTRNTKGKGQIFLLALAGGEAQQISNYKYGVGNIAWHPNGQSLLFGTTVSLHEMLADSILNPAKKLPIWSMEKPGFANNTYLQKDNKIKANPDGSLAEIRAYLAKDEEDKKAKVINNLNFQTESSTDSELYFDQIQTIEAKENGKILPLLTGYSDFNAGTWSISGQNLYYTSALDSTAHPNRANDVAIFNLDIKTGKKSLVIGNKNTQYQIAALSKDGLKLAIKYNPTNGVNFGQIATIDVDGKNYSPINFDRNAGDFNWSQNSQSLYFTAQSNGGQPLYQYNFIQKKLTQLSDNESGILKFVIANNKFIYNKTNIDTPSDLFANNFTFKDEKQISSHNTWVKDRLLSKPVKNSFVNEKGLEIEYWIMKPAHFDASKKYPLLLNMHGGPTAMWGPGEASMWHEFQYMCAQGYGIVYANPRGSGGYGLDFQQANIKDWGTGPAYDVLKACDIASAQSWVDTSKLVLTGGSYAGYLTAWIVGHDHRFKAAFSQRGVYDLTTFMGEGNAWGLVPDYFGLPWNPDDKAILDRESPYSYVKNIKTPLLIKHGENDLRTGVIQSEMLYKSMKYMEKPVEYVRMPGGTHELSRTGNVRQRIDRLLRIYEFFERYVSAPK